MTCTPITEDDTSDEESDEAGAVSASVRNAQDKPRSQRRGRPRKPDPVINMSATKFIAANKTLDIEIYDGDKKISFRTNPPRQTKAGKVGWTFSHKASINIDGVNVTFQITGNAYGIRSDKWKR